MSDRMRPIPFGQLMDWIIEEYQTYGSIFGVSKLVRHAEDEPGCPFSASGWRPLRPRGRPAHQLAQNLISLRGGQPVL
ncbi:MAG: hypothetical protein ACLVL7_11655 [Anaerotruncus massiliensis (ex Togo et al. 2019)]